MTVAALAPAIEYLEDGISLAFPVPFRFNAPEHVAARSTAALDGVVTVLVYGVDYTVTGGATDAGGTLTRALPGVAGDTLAIERATPRAQTTDYQTDDIFPAETHEAALDRAMLIDQEQDELLDRALIVAGGDSVPPIGPLAGFQEGDTLVVRDGRLQWHSRPAFAGKYFAGDGTGGLVPASGTGNDPDLRADLANPSLGASLVAFLQAGIGAVVRTVLAKLRENKSVGDFGAVGDGVTNDAPAIQKALDAMTEGGVLLVNRGSYFLAAGLVVSHDFTSIVFERGASFIYATATMTAITINGAGCSIVGGALVGPATFDGTNSPITYANVWVAGDETTIDTLRIFNVPRCGIYFKDCNGGKVTNCRIDGGTAEGFFTGINTVHFGIGVDPPSTGAQGNFVFQGNTLKRCVQGAGTGNLGAASWEQGFVVNGNNFELCWNHGWYSSGLANGSSITGNTFSACQVPIAVTGSDHVITGNTLFVQTTGTALLTDNEVTGISLRDPIRCVVVGNVIRGEGVNGGCTIGFDDLGTVSAGDVCRNNICANNTIEITNTTTGGVVAIRFLGNNSIVRDNLCEGNVISAPVRDADALITVSGAAAGSSGNKIVGNTVRMTRAQGAYFVSLNNNVAYSEVSRNTFELAADAPTAKTVIGVAFNTTTRCRVDDNHFFVTAAWGGNVTYRVFQEYNAPGDNSAKGNRVHFGTAKPGFVGQLFFPHNGGPFMFEHVGTGAPEGIIIAGPGSIWRATDTGKLYVKETGNSNTGWVMK